MDTSFLPDPGGPSAQVSTKPGQLQSGAERLDGEWFDGPVPLPRLQQLLWVFKDCNVQAFVDERGSVDGYSITQRSSRFRPRFTFPPRSRRPRWWRRGRPFLHIELGKTRLSDAVGDAYPAAIRLAQAVRPWFYADLYYFGNPGYYLCFVAAASNVGNLPAVGALFPVVDEVGYSGWPGPGSDGPQWDELAATRRFRDQTVATTYGVMRSQHVAEHIPWWGPHGDEIRMMLDAR